MDASRSGAVGRAYGISIRLDLLPQLPRGITVGFGRIGHARGFRTLDATPGMAWSNGCARNYRRSRHGNSGWYLVGPDPYVINAASGDRLPQTRQLVPRSRTNAIGARRLPPRY